MIKLETIKANMNNPRAIGSEELTKLANSIKSFPKMMELRPIIINNNNVVIGGNQRLKALHKLGYTEIPESWIKKASELTEDEINRFIVQDNISSGSWDLNQLESWDAEELMDWGLDVLEDFEEDDEEVSETEYSEPEVRMYKQTHILLSMRPEKLIEIKEQLELIKQINGIEYEQSSN